MLLIGTDVLLIGTDVLLVGTDVEVICSSGRFREVSNEKLYFLLIMTVVGHWNHFNANKISFSIFAMQILTRQTPKTQNFINQRKNNVKRVKYFKYFTHIIL